MSCRAHVCGVGSPGCQLSNQVINLHQEFLARGMRRTRDHCRRSSGNLLVPGHASPSPNFTICEQCKVAKINAPACISKITEQILESK